MTKPGNLLITGCSGFVGNALAVRASHHGYNVTGTSRQASGLNDNLFRWVQMPDFSGREWLKLLEPIDVIIHCAARVHQIHEDSQDPFKEYKAVNVDGTRKLAEFAIKAGVTRFILLSSVKVNGDSTKPGSPFKAGDPPAPSTHYGQSKWEAERLIKELFKDRLAWIIVRPPLVYGPEAKGNLALFEKLARCRLPLPLGHIENRRSLISISHLVEFLLHCVSCEATNETVLIADSKPLSTAEIFDLVGRLASCPTICFGLPKPMQPLANALLKRLGLFERLAGSLEVDTEDSLKKMQWAPPDNFPNKNYPQSGN